MDTQTSKHPAIMVLLRELVLSCLRHNIFQACHIAGLLNSSADYISRSQVTGFKRISPDADQFPILVPENLMPKSWVLTAGGPYKRRVCHVRNIKKCMGILKSLNIVNLYRVTSMSKLKIDCIDCYYTLLVLLL